MIVTKDGLNVNLKLTPRELQILEFILVTFGESTFEHSNAGERIWKREKVFINRLQDLLRQKLGGL